MSIYDKPFRLPTEQAEILAKIEKFGKQEDRMFLSTGEWVMTISDDRLRVLIKGIKEEEEKTTGIDSASYQLRQRLTNDYLKIREFMEHRFGVIGSIDKIYEYSR